MATKRAKPSNRTSEDRKSSVLWVETKDIPDMITWYHTLARTDGADEVLRDGRVACFYPRAYDSTLFPQLEGVTMIYLGYKRFPNENPEQKGVVL